MASLNRVGNVVVDRSEKDADKSRRRTKPADVGPYSPAKIEALFSEGKKSPSLGTKDDEAQRPQFTADKPGKDYHNDVADGWLRGSGGDGRKPVFDSGKLDPASSPPKPAGGLRASGDDCHKSPFSTAHNMKPKER
jgi:hypothetical protein